VPANIPPSTPQASPEPIANRTRSNTAQTKDIPIAHRTRSKLKHFVAARTQVVNPHGSERKEHLPSAFPVLDDSTGNVLEYRQLRNHPSYADTWNTSYANELGRLCQDIGRGTQGPYNQRVAGTNTFRAIPYHAIPKERRNEITLTTVV